jgi:hypothetical protein
VSPVPSTERFVVARPVADAPVDALLARADELARRWASALIAARPLAEMARVPLEDLARQAPALCAQLARALSSDTELQRLLAHAEAGATGRADSRSGVLGAWLAPAGDASSAVRDVEALRAIITEAALSELREPTARQVADLADRLTSLCAALLAAVLDQHELARPAPTPSALAPPSREQVLYRSPQASPGGRGAALIDERDETVGPPARGRQVPVAGRAAAPSYEGARAAPPRAPEHGQEGQPPPAAPRPRPWDTPLDAVSPSASALADRAPHRAMPDGADAELRVMRGSGAPVDERA